MADVIWSEAATGQLLDIRGYIDTFDPAAARQTVARLDALALSLSTFPHRGRPGLKANTREMTAVSPYVLTYEVIGDLVVILDVRHGRQRPRTR